MPLRACTRSHSEGRANNGRDTDLIHCIFGGNKTQKFLALEPFSRSSSDLFRPCRRILRRQLFVTVSSLWRGGYCSGGNIGDVEVFAFGNFEVDVLLERIEPNSVTTCEGIVFVISVDNFTDDSVTQCKCAQVGPLVSVHNLYRNLDNGAHAAILTPLDLSAIKAASTSLAVIPSERATSTVFTVVRPNARRARICP